MADLRAVYRQALPGRIQALESARATMGSPEAEATVRRIAHSLRGSGGTYGYPEVTAAATAVENAEPANLPAMLDQLIAVLRSVAAEPEREATILLVDDEEEQDLLVRAVLERPGRRIITAATRAEAREILDRERVALILLDLLLGDGDDGRSMLLELRERPETAEIPVIIISGKSGPQAKSECFSLGATGFLEKPVDTDLLSAVVAAQLRGAVGQPAAAPPPQGSGGCVMIVEDDDLVASVLRHRLEREGLCIRHFRDGVAALEAIKMEPFRLAILDVKVPGMDGFEVLAQLRAHPSTAAIPVIMLTSLGGEREVLRGFQLGANDYILKPFSPVEVLARVKRLLPS